MTFGLKDVIYFTVFGASMAAVWMRFSERVVTVERITKTLKSMVFSPTGETQVCTRAVCAENRAGINRELDKAQANSDKVLEEIKCLSRNMLIIMIHLDIDVDKAKGLEDAKQILRPTRR